MCICDCASLYDLDGGGRSFKIAWMGRVCRMYGILCGARERDKKSAEDLCLCGKRNFICIDFSSFFRNHTWSGGRAASDIPYYISDVRSWKQQYPRICTRGFYRFVFNLCIRRRYKSNCCNFNRGFSGTGLRQPWKSAVRQKKIKVL